MAINLQEYVVSLGAKVDAKSLAELTKYLDMGKLKATAMGAAMVAAGKLIYNFVRDTTSAEQALVTLARQQSKSIAATRAQQNALKAMGKTLQEVSKDTTLKRIYTEVVKLNKTIPAPDTRTALADIESLQTAFISFKSSIQYAMQWVNYHILRNLEAPIRRITTMLQKLRDGLNKNMNSIAARIASYISAFARGLMSIVELGVKIVEWVHKLPDGIKAIGTAALAVFALLKSGPLGQMMALVTAIGGLIQDYENFKWNKANADKEQVPIAFPSIWELIDDEDMSGGEKFIGIGRLIAEKIGEGLSGFSFEDLFSGDSGLVAGLGVALVGALFGPSAKIKIIAAIAGAILAAASDPDFLSNCAEVAEALGKAIVDAVSPLLAEILPQWARELLGLQNATEKEAESTVGEGVTFDETGRAVTEWEKSSMSEEQRARLKPAESYQEMQFLYDYNAATKAYGLELHQSPGALYPSMVGPKNLSDANNEYMRQFNQMWEEAIQSKNGEMLKDLAKVGAAFQSEYNAAPNGFLGIRTKEEGNAEAAFAEQLQEISEKEYSITLLPEADTGAMTQVAMDLHSYVQTYMRSNPIEIVSKITTPSSTEKNAMGGRYASPITTEVAEDGDPEYIIPIRKTGRAFPLITQMLREMGGSAIQRVMADLGLDGGADTIGGSLGQGTSGASGMSITINNNYTISAPCNITVNASGADGREIGTAAYNAAKRHLIRTVRSVFS